jgi:DNA primase
MINKRALDYVFETLGEPLTKRRGWFSWPCPYHNGENPNFGVNIYRNKFNCFVCGESGNINQLISDLKEGIASPNILSTPLLGDIEIPEYEREKERVILNRLSDPEALKQCDLWFRDNYAHILNVEECRLKEMAINYLTKRGIDPEKVNVGFLKGYSGRVIFPFQQGGSIIYFQGRNFINKPLKTMNPDPDKGWNIKTNILYNYDELILRDRISLTEGIFDCHSVNNIINLPGTCLLGKTISKNQIKLLKFAGVKEILILFDGDANKEAIDIGIKLYNNKFKVSVVIWPNEYETQDPSSMSPLVLKKIIHDNSTLLTHISSMTLPLEYA